MNCPNVNRWPNPHKWGWYEGSYALASPTGTGSHESRGLNASNSKPGANIPWNRGKHYILWFGTGQTTTCCGGPSTGGHAKRPRMLVAWQPGWSPDDQRRRNSLPRNELDTGRPTATLVARRPNVVLIQPMASQWPCRGHGPRARATGHGPPLVSMAPR